MFPARQNEHRIGIRTFFDFSHHLLHLINGSGEIKHFVFQFFVMSESGNSGNQRLGFAGAGGGAEECELVVGVEGLR